MQGQEIMLLLSKKGMSVNLQKYFKITKIYRRLKFSFFLPKNFIQSNNR